MSSGYYVVADDMMDFGLSLLSECHCHPSIAEAEKYIKENGKSDVMYHVAEVVKTVRFKKSVELEEIGG